MNRVRRGKDFKVLWSFFDFEGKPYPLDKTFLTLYVSNSFDRFEVKDFVVEENTITWLFRGKDQKTLGDYSLELIKNNGAEGMIPIDSVDAFTLVQYSRDESLCGGGNVKIEDVTVNSTLDIETIASLAIDTEFSETSSNALANNVITKEFKKINEVIENKVDKEDGKGLSSNDYTDEEREKLESIEKGAQKNGYGLLSPETYKLDHIKADGTWEYVCPASGGPDYVTTSIQPDSIYRMMFGDELNIYGNAFKKEQSGIYIKTSNVQVKNHSITIGYGIGKIADAYIPDSIARTAFVETAINSKAEEIYGITAGLATEVSSINQTLLKKQDNLVSGENIKTINGESILGKGNITIEGKNYDNEIAEQSAKLTELSEEKEDKTNKVTSLSDESTDNQYPSAKCVHDSLSSLAEEMASNGQLIEDLQNMKIDRENDDYYPKMAVGLADNLAGVDVVDSEINFRRSGGGAISDGVARIESIKGNSVVWNQLAMKATKSTTMNGVTFTVNSDGSIVANGTASATAYIVINNNYYTDASHKYAVFGTPNGGSTATYYFGDGNALNDIDGNGTIRNGRGTNSTFACRVQSSNTATNLVYRPRLIDLTQMFGAGNEPTTIEEFYARIPMGIDLNAYNEGEVIHMDVQSIESQGVNAWDEEWELGNISNGNDIADSNRIRSKNYIHVFPNTAYYVTTFASTQFNLTMYDADKQYVGVLAKANSFSHTMPSNVHYVRFAIGASSTPVTTYKEGICINLSDASINGKYFPYIKRVEDLSIVRKYFPDGMRSAGAACDEIRYFPEANRWAKRSLKQVDMGTLNWSAFTTMNGLSRTQAPIPDFVGGVERAVSNIRCAKFPTIPSSTSMLGNEALGLFGYTNNRVFVLFKEGEYTDPAAFKAAMQGVILYYEPTDFEWVELDEADQFKDLDYQVWNCGTEKAIAEGKSAPLAADITYGFNAIGKIKELESLMAALRAKVGI